MDEVPECLWALFWQFQDPFFCFFETSIASGLEKVRAAADKFFVYVEAG